MNLTPLTQRGFTLTEIAVTLAIVGSILAAIAVPLAGRWEANQVADTERSLELILDALIGFAIANGRLPCPADPSNRAGDEARIESGETSGCSTQSAASESNIATGSVPWTTLGVPATDAWGHRFIYSVETRSTDRATFDACARPPVVDVPTRCPAPEASAAIEIRQRFGRAGTLNTLPVIATNLAAVVASSGKNGHWAFSLDGRQSRPSGIDPADDEGENSIQLMSPGIVRDRATFFGGPPRAGSRDCNDRTNNAPCPFDDLVVPLSRIRLLANFAAAGRLE